MTEWIIALGALTLAIIAAARLPYEIAKLKAEARKANAEANKLTAE